MRPKTRWADVPPEWVGWIIILAGFLLLAIDVVYRVILLQIQTGR